MDNNIKNRRLKTLRNYLKFLEQNPDDWNDLRMSCRNNVSEYSSFLKDYCSIFNNIPTKLVKAKDLLSNAKKWESYKVQWYKELSSNYPDSWIPISDFQSGEDEIFVDIADEGLPILITKFMGRNDFRKEVACKSLILFINEHKKSIADDLRKHSFGEMEVIKAFEEAWNRKDSSQLSLYITSNFSYASQWVLEELHTSIDYLNYLENKFQAIRNSGNKVTAKIIPNTNGIMITQIDGEKKREAILVIKVQNGLAFRADLCMPEFAFYLEKIQ